MVIIREIASPYQVKMFGQDEEGNIVHHQNVELTLREINKLYLQLQTQLAASPADRPTIHTPEDAYPILEPFLAPLSREELWVLCLSTRNKVTSINQIYKGSLNSSNVRVGELFRQAIMEQSAAIIVAHNHPSGDPMPSPDDVAVTRAIVEAGRLLDIDVLDHLVISVSGFISLKQRGLGFSD